MLIIVPFLLFSCVGPLVAFQPRQWLPLPPARAVARSACIQHTQPCKLVHPFARSYLACIPLHHGSSDLSSSQQHQLSLTDHNSAETCSAATLSPVSAKAVLGSLTKSLLVFASAFGGFARKAEAASNGLHGWDLYGRVPYDDWLFTNQRLLDPDLLKSSYVEAVAREIPDALAIFRRRRFVQEGTAVVMGVSAIATLLTLLGSLAWNRRTSFQKMREREIQERGFATPISAVIRGRRPVGRAMDMDDDYTVLDPLDQPSPAVEADKTGTSPRSPAPSPSPSPPSEKRSDRGGKGEPPTANKDSATKAPSGKTSNKWERRSFRDRYRRSSTSNKDKEESGEGEDPDVDRTGGEGEEDEAGR